ncbi:signal peptidase I [Candidatus Kaiserbacteria bacterium]|nr:signal peptidase I [Candidatus Kaiserbacteria bacterium]
MSELFQNKRDGISTNDQFEAAPASGMREAAQNAGNSPGRGALFGYTILALGLALFIRFFIAAPYVVSGSSMEPNFQNWDYLITDRISYRIEEPSRGDVIVFHLPQEYSRTLIKRVIGLPGETVTVNGAGITIQNAEHPDGFYIEEPYLAIENLGGPQSATETLGEGQYFVMGDNRRVSSDSRTWGVLPRENIVGRVLLRLFPLSKLGILPAEARYLED